MTIYTFKVKQSDGWLARLGEARTEWESTRGTRPQITKAEDVITVEFASAEDFAEWVFKYSQINPQ